MIALEDLAIQYGARALYQNVQLNLVPGRRYCITGANGAGKSTLFRLISGEESPSEGKIRVPKQSSIGFLKQDHFEYEDQRIVDVVLQGRARLWQALARRAELFSKSDLTNEEGVELCDLEMIMAEEEGYTAETQAGEILTGLGIDVAHQQNPMHTLSGGYKLRVLMAQTLFQNPDILLLDEPTNHLDMVAIHWLEGFLKKEYKGILCVVSHDKHFMNKLATDILDLDFGTISSYVGNFDQSLEEKALLQSQKAKEQAGQQKKIEHLEAYVRRFGAKASKAKQAQSRQKQIDKMERVEALVSSRRAPRFQFEQAQRSGQRIVDIKSISKAFGERSEQDEKGEKNEKSDKGENDAKQIKQVLNNVSFGIRRGEKVAIIGPNGVGKSTLIKILMDQLKADSGSFEWGHEISVGYFAQDHGELLDPNQNAYEWLLTQTSNRTESELRKALGLMLFSKEDVFKKIKNLSGGEATRLLFALLSLQKNNVLVLDEPTNHLDLESLEALSQGLQAYPGTVIFVSHDQDFVKDVATRVIAIHHDEVKDHKHCTEAVLDQLLDEYFELSA